MTNAEVAVKGVVLEPFALRALDRLAETIVVGALLGELLLVLANVMARVFFRQSFLWSDEVARLVLSILAFIGGAVAYRRRDHAQVRLILNLVPRRVERVCLALADIIVFFVSGLIGAASIEFIAASWAERTPILQAPAALIALPLPAGMALIALYAAVRVWREHGRLALIVGALFLAATALAATTYGSWLPALGDDSSIIVALVLFFAAIFAGVPVGFVLLLAGRFLSLDERRGAVARAAANHGRRRWELHSPRGSLFHPRRTGHGARRDQRAADPLHPRAGRPFARRPAAGRSGQHVRDLRPSGSKPADVAAVGTIMRDESRAPRRRRGRGGAGGLGDHGRDGAAEHRHADRRFDHQCVGGGHVHRRPDAGGGDRAMPDGADRVSRPSRRRACPLLAPR